MNSCNFTGRLTKDPELKTTQGGKNYTRFCLAVDGIKDKDGNKSTDFIDCVAWSKTAEIIAKYARKGSKLGISGRLHTTTYDKDGEKRKSVDIVVNEFDLLDSKPKDQAQTETAATAEEPELPFEV
jgi:single-strand DNA-binding protein